MPVKPMLAKDAADLSALPYPQYAQPKLDGIRAMVQDGVVLSRTLKPIPNREVQRTLGRPQFEGFDGELIVGDIAAADCYRKTTSFVMAPDKPFPDVQEPWTFHAFDLTNRTEAAYALRLDRLRGLIGRLTADQRDYVALVYSARVNSAADVDRVESDWLALGLEGVILRDPSGLYKHGRSGKLGPLLKVKRFVDFEAEVVGVYEEMHNANAATTNELGRTARSSAQAGKVGKGTLGGLILKAINGPAEGVEFRCGTGFDHATRVALWTESLRFADRARMDTPERVGLNGRVAKIKSFPIGVKDKPRHPVFLGWRDMSVDG